MIKVKRLPITEHGRNLDWDHRKVTEIHTEYENGLTLIQKYWVYCTKEETFTHVYRSTSKLIPTKH